MKKLALYLLTTGFFITGISLVYRLKTQEKKEISSLSPALKTFTGVGLACAAISSRLPYALPASAALMRRYLLSGLTAQTTAGTALSLSETIKTENPSLTKAATDIGYGVYNMAFVEIARRMPYNTPARALLLRRYATLCLASQALGLVGKEYIDPAYCAIKRGIGAYTASLPSEQLEETANCLSFSE